MSWSDWEEVTLSKLVSTSDTAGIEQAVKKLSAALASNQYLLGDQVTAADIIVYSALLPVKVKLMSHEFSHEICLSCNNVDTSSPAVLKFFVENTPHASVTANVRSTLLYTLIASFRTRVPTQVCCIANIHWVSLHTSFMSLDPATCMQCVELHAAGKGEHLTKLYIAFYAVHFRHSRCQY